MIEPYEKSIIVIMTKKHDLFLFCQTNCCPLVKHDDKVFIIWSEKSKESNLWKITE